MPEVTISGTPSKLTFTYKGIAPEPNAIIPRVRFDFDVHYTVAPGYPGNNIILNLAKSEVKIIPKVGEKLYGGTLIPLRPWVELSPGSPVLFYLYADLDHYRLTQIEKVREGGSLQVLIELFIVAEIQKEPPVKQTATILVQDIRIPKSDWVETILPQLKYKDISLIEVPKIEKPIFSDIVVKLNEAWKQYCMGEYDKVLTECRKAMEGLTTLVKTEGFEKEVTDDNGKKKKAPDWEKVLGHKKTGEIIEAIAQKHFGFLAPGAHYGKSINREDAELAIMLTHGLVNFISKKF